MKVTVAGLSGLPDFARLVMFAKVAGAIIRCGCQAIGVSVATVSRAVKQQRLLLSLAEDR
jgi:hypothetical protein